MISAKEAREQAKLKISSDDEKVLNKIEGYIKTAMNCGHRDVSKNGTLSKSVVIKLKELGYEVRQGSQYNEDYYSILW